jgi:diguanylate cyclase with GGDEF domain
LQDNLSVFRFNTTRVIAASHQARTTIRLGHVCRRDIAGGRRPAAPGRSPAWLSKQARWDALRSNVGEIGQLAASVVDGDLHRQLLDPANYSDELYNRALAPLVRFHSSDRDIFYVYTMVERDGVAYFVLDTAASPDLKTDRKLEASGYMERFDVREEYNDDWLEQLAAGKTYVNPSFEEDDYGTFLTGDSPIYDSQGRYSGFVGVDFDLEYYFAQEARFRAIAVGSLIAALLLALAIGYLATRYYSAMRNRMQEFYENSIRDSLTGLLNRRGAIEAITKSLARHPGTNATLLVDIDNLKMINDLRGHIAGDAVIVRTADAIRQSIRDGDGCARRRVHHLRTRMRLRRRQDDRAKHHHHPVEGKDAAGGRQLRRFDRHCRASRGGYRFYPNVPRSRPRSGCGQRGGQKSHRAVRPNAYLDPGHSVVSHRRC